jgi:hypothetical protein
VDRCGVKARVDAGKGRPGRAKPTRFSPVRPPRTSRPHRRPPFLAMPAGAIARRWIQAAFRGSRRRDGNPRGRRWCRRVRAARPRRPATAPSPTRSTVDTHAKARIDESVARVNTDPAGELTPWASLTYIRGRGDRRGGLWWSRTVSSGEETTEPTVGTRSGGEVLAYLVEEFGRRQVHGGVLAVPALDAGGVDEDEAVAG